MRFKLPRYAVYLVIHFVVFAVGAASAADDYRFVPIRTSLGSVDFSAISSGINEDGVVVYSRTIFGGQGVVHRFEDGVDTVIATGPNSLGEVNALGEIFASLPPSTAPTFGLLQSDGTFVPYGQRMFDGSGDFRELQFGGLNDEGVASALIRTNQNDMIAALIDADGFVAVDTEDSTSPGGRFSFVVGPVSSSAEIAYVASDSSLPGVRGFFSGSENSLPILEGEVPLGCGTSSVFDRNAVGTFVATSTCGVYTASEGSSQVVIPFGPGTGFGNGFHVAINDLGELAFLASDSLNAGAIEALFTGPDPVDDLVVQESGALFGGLVEDINFRRFGFNNRGDLLFVVSVRSTFDNTLASHLVLADRLDDPNRDRSRFVGLRGGSAPELVEIDPLLGGATSRKITGVDSVDAIAYDPSRKTLFGIGRLVPAGTAELLSIDPDSGQAVPEGLSLPAGEILGLAFDGATNTIAAVDDAGALFQFSPDASGSANQVGSTSEVPGIESLVFARGRDRFYSVDPTGALLLGSTSAFGANGGVVANIGPGTIRALAYDSYRDRLVGYDAAADEIIEIDPDTGARLSLFVPLSPSELVGLSSLSAVPESDFAMALLVASGSLTFVSRRRCIHGRGRSRA